MNAVQVNIWAVLVATVANVVVGSLWYSLRGLGKPWMALIGKTPEQIEAGYKPSMMVWTVISALVSNLILAIIVAWSGANTLLEGVVVGLTVGIGIAFVTRLSAGYVRGAALCPDADRRGLQPGCVRDRWRHLCHLAVNAHDRARQ